MQKNAALYCCRLQYRLCDSHCQHIENLIIHSLDLHLQIKQMLEKKTSVFILFVEKHQTLRRFVIILPVLSSVLLVAISSRPSI